MFVVQSSEKRKVCLNKASISKLSQAYQSTTNYNLEAAMYLIIVHWNQSWAFVSFCEACCAMQLVMESLLCLHYDSEIRVSAPQYSSPENATGSQRSLLTLHVFYS